MTLKERKIQKILDYYFKEIPIEGIATLLKIKENTVKKYLKERLGYSYQAERIHPPPYSRQAGVTKCSYQFRDSQVSPPSGNSGNYIPETAASIRSQIEEPVREILKENTALKKTNEQLTTELQTANEIKETQKVGLDTKDLDIKQKNIQIDELNQQKTNLINENETYKQQRADLPNLVSTQDQTLMISQECFKLIQASCKKLDELKNYQDPQEIKRILQEFLLEPQIFKNLIKKSQEETLKKFIHELENRDGNDKNAWIEYLTTFILGLAGGVILDQKLPEIKKFIDSFFFELGKSIGSHMNTIQPINGIQPDSHHQYNPANPVIITSGNLSSGMNHSNYGKSPDAEYPVYQNPQNGMFQTDRLVSSGDVTISTATYGTIHTSEAMVVNHVETMNIPQAPSSHYIPPPQISLVYFYPQFTPVPPELIGSFGWIPIRQMDWRQSTPFICWFFEQLGYTIIKVKKSHDKGADILLKRFGEILVIQIKHQMEHTGRKALQEALYAKTMLDATKAIVISFGGPFTEMAIRDEKKSGVELWTLERVITELRNHRICYPID